MKKMITIVLVFLVLGGCSTMSGRVGDMPTVTDEKSASKIVVIRISSIVGGANSYVVALDGKDLLKIRSGQHADFKINAGEHFIAVKCFGGWWPSWKEDSVKFVAKSNQSVYFEVSPDFSCAEIVKIAKTKADKRLSSSEKLNLTVKLKEEDQPSQDE